RTPGEPQTAAVSALCARQNLEQSALAGAVFAQEGVNFALAQRELDVRKRLGGAEALAHAGNAQQRRSRALGHASTRSAITATREMPCAPRRSSWRVEPLGEVRLHQLGDLRALQVVAIDQGGSGIDARFNRLLVQVRRQSFDREVTHLERILQDQRVDLTGVDPADQLVRGIEADEVDL